MAFGQSVSTPVYLEVNIFIILNSI
jgi:hypothetical protein